MRILSVDGGGYLGLATATFLKEIERHYDVRCADRFDLFCGTSTGAIIALALASGRSAADVATLYETLGPEVFPPTKGLRRLVPKRLRGIMGGPEYANDGLCEALLQEFQDLTLGQLRSRGKLVLVTAFNLSTGRPTLFKTDHAKELTAHDQLKVRDVLLATTAAPKYLQIAAVKDPTTGVTNRYCDGGLVANSPALLGYAEALSHLGKKPEEIEILSLSTPRVDWAEREAALSKAQLDDKRSYKGWGFGERIISLAIDGSSMATDTALQRISAATGTRYERVFFAQPKGVGLDVVNEAATRTLIQMGAERAADGSTRARLRPLFIT